jgi:tripartite-type tricarboxylate transporter receptor subunit TctC
MVRRPEAGPVLAGTPAEIVNILSAEFRKIIGLPEVKAQFDTRDFTAFGATADEALQSRY